jgi:hypothetical protein
VLKAAVQRPSDHVSSASRVQNEMARTRCRITVRCIWLASILDLKCASDLARDCIQLVPLFEPPGRAPAETIRRPARNDVQVCMWNILSSGRTVRQRECYAFARHSASLQRRSHALTAMSHLGDLGWRQIRERINMAARHYQRVPWVRGTNVEKGDHQIGFKHHARWHLASKDSAKDATGGHVWLTIKLTMTRNASVTLALKQ